MSRRVSLPGASELFRSTHTDVVPETPAGPVAAPSNGTEPAATEPTGRVRHDEKITVYVSSDELVALEQARLHLRSRHGMAVDRGRMVREAISAMLADFDVNGGDSELVRRLSKP